MSNPDAECVLQVESSIGAQSLRFCLTVMSNVSQAVQSTQLYLHVSITTPRLTYFRPSAFLQARRLEALSGMMNAPLLLEDPRRHSGVNAAGQAHSYSLPALDFPPPDHRFNAPHCSRTESCRAPF